MSILSLRTLFAELTQSLPKTCQKFGPQRRRSRLTQAAQPDAVQSLESRILPATITVTSLDDGMLANGFVTLREAIQAANTNKSVDGSVAGSVGEDTIIGRITTNGAAVGKLSALDIGNASVDPAIVCELRSRRIVVNRAIDDAANIVGGNPIVYN